MLIPTPCPDSPRGATRRLGLALAALAAFLPDPGRAEPPGTLVFNRDIKPLLSDNCYACHGPDPGSRKAGLRLDTREGLFEATSKRPAAIIPGKPDESEFWKRLVTTDEDDLMPPPNSHKQLQPAQKDLLRRWIELGAPWQPHWSLVRPERPPVPSTSPRDGFPVRNPIDAFILARLQSKGLQPAPPADPRTLARRLALDLTGLPPSPEEVERFARDPSPAAYERLVRRLMDSPAWGEHRGRYWLDAARYADTHGLHFDNYREMWPYRDWVIRAFNRNQRFDEFTLEQLAGDLLPNPTDDQLIATGFQRCNATTNEGGTIEAENLVNYANDRVTTLGWVWLGLTVNCASCHDHKFDPLTMRDFYSLAAFFRNTTQSGFDGNSKDGANASMVVIEDPADRARWAALPGEIQTAKETVAARKSAAEEPFAAWASSLKPEDIQKRLARDLNVQVPLTAETGSETPGTAGGAPRRFPIEGTTEWTDDGRGGRALRFQDRSSVVLADAGDFDLNQPFSYGGWIRVPSDWDRDASAVARMDEAAGHRGWDLWIQKDRFAAHFVNQWPGNALKVRTKAGVVRKGEWQHVLVAFDGSGTPEGVRIFVDGRSAELEPEARRVRGTLRTRTPLRLGRRSEGAAFTGGSIQDFRIYARFLTAPEALALVKPTELQAELATPFADWKPETRDPYLALFLLGRDDYQEARRLHAQLEDERESLRQRYPVTHIQREKNDSMPMAEILFRGQYDQPRDKVPAATPAVLHPFPADAPTNRLGLARWIVDPANPLTARVTVNRFWQELFGVGLVRTPEDLGIMGESPVHPDLLDWLAVEFVESGWDVKHLYRLMVTSSTYRQSAATTPDKLERDPGNRLLSRGPRFRMDAEMLRDYALEAAGLLDTRIGGPSVKPYQPDGVWEAVAMPESNTRQYQRDSGAALYRRSLYTFWKRSAPPALMDLFNAPSRETCSVRRERTNTPLQALATLNDPQFIEAARTLASDALARHRSGQAALSDLARRILTRPLQPEELATVAATLDAMRAYYDREPGDAEKLLKVGESPRDPSLPATELAALTLVANQLLNLDETLTK